MNTSTSTSPDPISRALAAEPGFGYADAEALRDAIGAGDTAAVAVAIYLLDPMVSRVAAAWGIDPAEPGITAAVESAVRAWGAGRIELRWLAGAAKAAVQRVAARAATTHRSGATGADSVLATAAREAGAATTAEALAVPAVQQWLEARGVTAPASRWASVTAALEATRPGGALTEWVAAPEATPEEVVCDGATTDDAPAWIGDLPIHPSCRATLRAIAQVGTSPTALAGALGCSPDAARGRRDTALAAARAAMADRVEAVAAA